MQSEILNVPLRGEPPLTQANAACVGGTPRRGNSKPSWLAQCKTDPVRTILNLIWLVLSGFWLALAYAFAGVIMCVLVITIPLRRRLVPPRRLRPVAVRQDGDPATGSRCRVCGRERALVPARRSMDCDRVVLAL